jgi:hypothetical protein
MKKKNILIIFFILLISFNLYSDKKSLIYPISIDIRIKSIFAGFRGNHFHGGIDFSTFGKKGIPVRAVENGYIFRLSNKFYGFGKAVYIRHKHFMSVYGHLDRFENKVLKLEDLSEQLVEGTDGRYFGDYFFEDKGVFVKKGQIIAYSGETGAGPPHLHFEIRDLDNNPINTFKYIKIEDLIPPRIGKIIFKPIKFRSFINGKLKSRIIKLNGKEKIDKPVYVSGPFAITITAWDKYYKYDRIGIYGWKLYIDKTLISEVKFDKIPFYRGHQIGLIYDLNKSSYKKDYFFYNIYPYYGEGIAKMYISPSALFEKIKTGKHLLKIVVYDYWGNHTIKTIDIVKTDNNPPVILRIDKISPVKIILSFKNKIEKMEIQIRGEEEKFFHRKNYRIIDERRIEISVPRPFDGLKYYIRVRKNEYSPWGLSLFKTVSEKIDGFNIKKAKNRLIINSLKTAVWEFGKKSGKIKTGGNIIPIYNGILRLRFGEKYYSFIFKKNGIKRKEEKNLLSDDIVIKTNKYIPEAIYMGDFYYKRFKPDFKKFFFVKKGEIKTIDINGYQMFFGKNSLFKSFLFEISREKYPFEPQVFPLRDIFTILPDNFPFKKRVILKTKLTDYSFKKRVGIFRYDKMAGRWRIVGEKIKNGYMFAKIWLGGTYALMADEYPPELKFYFPKNGRRYGRIARAVAIIRDRGKGIDYHKTFFIINGKKLWAIYDPDKASMFYPISKFVKTGKNNLTAIVYDYAGNVSIKKIIFYKLGKK